MVFILLNFISMSVQRYDEALAVQLSRLSGASYCPARKLMALKCGFQCQHLVKSNWTPLYSAEHPLLLGTSASFSIFVNKALHKVVVAFRGTDGNLQLLQQILSSTGVPYGMQTSQRSILNVGYRGPLVQKYFHDNYQKALRIPLFQQLKIAKAAYPTFQFIFTGHSLGGAFSILALTDVVRSKIFPPKNLSSYTFGAPRVGNTDFNRLYHEAVGDSFRVVHRRDIVPHLPPCSMNPVTGVCMKSDSSSLISWFPYHSNQEVFYDNTAMLHGTHKFCKEEDRHCADRYTLVDTNINDHLFYFGTRVSCDP